MFTCVLGWKKKKKRRLMYWNCRRVYMYLCRVNDNSEEYCTVWLYSSDAFYEDRSIYRSFFIVSRQNFIFLSIYHPNKSYKMHLRIVFGDLVHELHVQRRRFYYWTLSDQQLYVFIYLQRDIVTDTCIGETYFFKMKIIECIFRKVIINIFYVL